MSELERATMADLQERELARLRSDLAGMAAQNAAMREALVNIVSYADELEGVSYNIQDAAILARAALAQPKESQT